MTPKPFRRGDRVAAYGWDGEALGRGTVKYVQSLGLYMKVRVDGMGYDLAVRQDKCRRLIRKKRVGTS